MKFLLVAVLVAFVGTIAAKPQVGGVVDGGAGDVVDGVLGGGVLDGVGDTVDGVLKLNLTRILTCVGSIVSDLLPKLNEGIDQITTGLQSKIFTIDSGDKNISFASE